MQFLHTRGSLLWAAASVLALGSHVWLLASSRSEGLILCSFAVSCLVVSCSLASRVGPETGASCAASSSRIAVSGRASAQSITPASPRNALTIDLEDYFHTEVASRSVPFTEWGSMPPRIEHSTHRLLDLLDEANTRATVFVLGWLAERHPALVREVSERGHEIACHSYAHRLVFSMQPREFREDTRRATRLIEQVCGTRVEGYRAPCFSITPGTEWAFETLAELGYRWDSSVNPIWHRTYAAPRAPRYPYRQPGSGLLELPVATCALAGLRLPVGGGAYLRLLPYWYSRAGLSAINTLERKPATLYLHPWELDSYSPLIPQDWSSRVRQTWGTSTMERKLRSLLAGSLFGPISEVYAEQLRASARAVEATEPSSAMAGVV